ncbi:MAG: hypothetical protein AAF449_10980, partial [Myxococcota bacterium]
PAPPPPPSASPKRARRPPPRAKRSPLSVETRSERLQNRIMQALAEAEDAQRRAQLRRLVGQLSMVQAGRDPDQQRRQLMVLEKELDAIIKDKAGTPADRR